MDQIPVIQGDEFGLEVRFWRDACNSNQGIAALEASFRRTEFFLTANACGNGIRVRLNGASWHVPVAYFADASGWTV